MPGHALAVAHAKELAGLEAVEIERLFKLYERARIELYGRLASLPFDRFSAQQVRCFA